MNQGKYNFSQLTDFYHKGYLTVSF